MTPIPGLKAAGSVVAVQHITMIYMHGEPERDKITKYFFLCVRRKKNCLYNSNFRLEMLDAHALYQKHIQPDGDTECPKIYRKSVLYYIPFYVYAIFFGV